MLPDGNRQSSVTSVIRANSVPNYSPFQTIPTVVRTVPSLPIQRIDNSIISSTVPTLVREYIVDSAYVPQGPSTFVNTSHLIETSNSLNHLPSHYASEPYPYRTPYTPYPPSTEMFPPNEIIPQFYDRRFEDSRRNQYLSHFTPDQTVQYHSSSGMAPRSDTQFYPQTRNSYNVSSDDLTVNPLILQRISSQLRGEPPNPIYTQPAVSQQPIRFESRRYPPSWDDEVLPARTRSVARHERRTVPRSYHIPDSVYEVVSDDSSVEVIPQRRSDELCRDRRPLSPIRKTTARTSETVRVKEMTPAPPDSSSGSASSVSSDEEIANAEEVILSCVKDVPVPEEEQQQDEASVTAPNNEEPTTQCGKALASVTAEEITEVITQKPKISDSMLRKHKWALSLFEEFCKKANKPASFPLDILSVCGFLRFLAIHAKYSLSGIEAIIAPALRRMNADSGATNDKPLAIAIACQLDIAVAAFLNTLQTFSHAIGCQFRTQ